MTNQYTSYSETPWYRRNWFASLLTGLGVFLPPLLGIVCLLLVTGDIYQNAYTKAGKLHTWSRANKVAAWVILGIQAVTLIYVVSLSNS